MDYSDGLVRNEDGTILVWVVVVRERYLPQGQMPIGRYAELTYCEVLREGFTTELRARNFAGLQVGEDRLVHLETMKLHLPGGR